MIGRSSKFDRLVDCVSDCLNSIGFKRKGANFILCSDNNVLIIQVQKSTSGSLDSPRFTLNLGVVCGLLVPDGNPKKAKLEESHLRVRIGSLLPERPDKWWTLVSEADTHRACLEINTLLIERAIPYLRQYLSADALLSLWESGESPGLTEVQRARYLEQLRSRL